jgi:hypothetical protein
MKRAAAFQVYKRKMSVHGQSVMNFSQQGFHRVRLGKEIQGAKYDGLGDTFVRT